VGIPSCLLSLAVNLVLLLLVAFSSIMGEAVVCISIMIAEWVLAAAFAVSFARWRDSTLSLAFCVGVAAGATPFLLWLAIGALATL
jgi:hypothetical protein